MQDWVSKRSNPYWNDPSRLAYTVPTRRAFFNDEVFHILTQQDSKPEVMEETVREASQRWFVGICGEHLTIPNDLLLREEFCDDLVRKTQHIFVPAFDQEGFLIWSPKQSDAIPR